MNKNVDPHFKISLQEKTQFPFKRKEKVRSQNILVVNRRQYSCYPNNRRLNTGNILIRKPPKSQAFCAKNSDGLLLGYNFFLTISENAISEKSCKILRLWPLTFGLPKEERQGTSFIISASPLFMGFPAFEPPLLGLLGKGYCLSCLWGLWPRRWWYLLLIINDLSATRIGKPILSNRLGVLNNLIKYDWLNLRMNSFRIISKRLFLMNYNWLLLLCYKVMQRFG